MDNYMDNMDRLVDRMDGHGRGYDDDMPMDDVRGGRYSAPRGRMDYGEPDDYGYGRAPRQPASSVGRKDLDELGRAVVSAQRKLSDGQSELLESMRREMGESFKEQGQNQELKKKKIYKKFMKPQNQNQNQKPNLDQELKKKLSKKRKKYNIQITINITKLKTLKIIILIEFQLLLIKDQEILLEVHLKKLLSKNKLSLILVKEENFILNNQPKLLLEEMQEENQLKQKPKDQILLQELYQLNLEKKEKK